jgi:predicted dehydrogenase
MKNICIVGCGKIGRFHSRNLSRSSNLFFHSRSKSSAEKFNQRFNGKGRFDRFDAVLKSAEIDAVVICSPPRFHKEQIIASLRAGKAVLVEKPMCISSAEIDEIEKTLEETAGNGFLMVAENYYYKPALKKIKQLLKERIIGEVRSVFVKKRFRQSATSWKSQYGALFEGGIHFVAFISDIFDDDPGKVTAYFPHAKKGEMERFSITELEYKNKAFAQLTYSWNAKSLMRGVFQNSYIVGDKGKIIFESNGIYVFLKSGRKTGLYLSDLRDVLGYTAMTTDFLACLDDGTRTPYSDFHKAKRDLNIVFRAYEHLDT